jgi:Mn2+/Fe2+ NRAMP family transporter
MKRLLSILLWSVIAAAFIGPGTVTTAASAGARFGYALLWALVFSTVATLVLQEASARVTIASGLNLGQAIQRRFSGGVRGILVLTVVLGAVVFGCAAYEAGNILGGVAGAALGTGINVRLLTLVLGGLAGVLLWIGTPRAVAYVLSGVVAFMGAVFLVTAAVLSPSLSSIVGGSLVPRLPAGSGLLVLGLIGTTVVPYNLFLGSGLARGQRLGDVRSGLAFSIVLGGAISMGVLVVGTAVTGAFSYEALATTLAQRVGGWAAPLFAFGLMAAGFTSAVTAPLAAAITASSLFEKGENRWHDRSLRYRAVWIGVLLIGVGFGLADVRPIPAIILAQAFNGILLPFTAVFLLLVVNDRCLMGERLVNGRAANTVMSMVVAVTIVLGVSNVLRAVAAVGKRRPDERVVLAVAAMLAVVLAIPVARAVRERRRG